MGQKARSIKNINDNPPLFENKTAEADLGCSFQIRTPENLVNGFKKLDLVHDTPFVHPVVKPQNENGVQTPSDTIINLNKNNVNSLNVKSNILSTTESSYSNKENLSNENKENLNSPDSKKKLTPNNNSYSLIIKKNVENIENKPSVNNNVIEDTFYVSPETSKYNYDTSLYHSIRETTIIPNSLHSSLSLINSDSQVDSFLSTKQLGCQPLNGQPKHTTLEELSPAAKRNNFIIRARSPIRPVDFIQDGEFKRPINSFGSVCFKCANENFISVKGINYNILNTLGHGGSSIVYEVNILYIIYYKIRYTG